MDPLSDQEYKDSPEVSAAGYPYLKVRSSYHSASYSVMYNDNSYSHKCYFRGVFKPNKAQLPYICVKKLLI